ncbi:SPOR domain-containing protein, partial [Saprospiraceae bacterium]|nr:SPOR domain-containing protein [Saprospiraceae bacterium]
SDDTELLAEEMDGSDYTSDGEFEGDDSDFDAKPESEGDMDAFEDDDYEAGDYTTSEADNEKRFPSKETSKSKGNTKLTPRKKRDEPAVDRNPYADAGSSGSYMVIAGSYLLEDNAKSMVKKLQGMGYANAEIVYFDQSQYHSICAGKYDSNGSAAKTASNLKSSGIDSYVHRRQ